MKRALLALGSWLFLALWILALVVAPSHRARGDVLPYADSVRLLIVSHGYRCEAITTAIIEHGGDTIHVGCDGARRAYTLERLDGRWLFFAPTTVVVVKIPATCGPAPRGEYRHCEAKRK